MVDLDQKQLELVQKRCERLKAYIARRTAQK